MATQDFSQLTCLDVVTSTKGKSATILDAGKEAFWLPGPLVVMFPPSAYAGTGAAPDAAARLSMSLRASPKALEGGGALDAWAIGYATAHSERLFGKVLSEAQVRDRYTSVIKISEKYPASLRVKISSEGRYAPTYWTPAKERRDAPADLQGCVIQPRVRVSSFYFMGAQFGVVLQLQSALVDSEASMECPF